MAAAWKLIIEDDAGRQIVVPFAKDVLTIGRKEGNTIRLTERNVSRFHAKLQKENGHVLVEDLGSYNGIKLNGDRISGRVVVNEGDTIQIGDYHLALHAAEGAATQKQTPAPAAGHRSASVDGAAPAGDDDEFAGDTQRWEPPGDMAPMAVGSLMQTQEELPRPPISEETARAPIQGVGMLDTLEGFAQDPAAQPTERFTAAPGLSAPMDSVPQRRNFTGNNEPTVRQPVAAPAPISGVGGAAPQLQGLAAVAVAPPLAPAAPPPPGPSLVTGETRPDRASPAQPPTIPMTPAAPPRPTATGVRLQASQMPTEQTEAMRPAPVAGEDVTVPRLFVINTVFAGSAFRINAPEMVIGRTEDNDITIEHRSVSRNHAKVVREGDRVRILDLKSANGVLVNDEEVESVVLKPGDVVELGRVKLRYVPIGERFAVSPEEIERARIADAAGEEFEGEASTGITNPVRNRSGNVPTFPAPEKKNNTVMLAAIGGLVVVAGIAAVLILRGGGKEPDEDAPKPPDTVAHAGTTPPPADVKAPDPPPVDVKPADPLPTDVKPADPAPVDAKPADDTPPADAQPGDDAAALDADPAAASDDPPGDTTRPGEPKRSTRPKLDVEKTLDRARQALKANNFELTARLANSVAASRDANATQLKNACVQVKSARAFCEAQKLDCTGVVAHKNCK